MGRQGKGALQSLVCSKEKPGSSARDGKKPGVGVGHKYGALA